MVDTKLLTRNIRLYLFFEIFSEPLFWGAILIFYVKKVSGMSLPEIYQMESLCLIIFVLWEIPTGALADMLGRRKTIFIGRTIILLHSVIFAIADSRFLIWTGNILWAFGLPLVSGADSSLVYDSLKALGREQEYKKIVGRAKAYRFIVLGIGALLTGYLTGINLRLGPYLSLIFLMLNVIVAFFFVEPPYSGQSVFTWREQWRLIKDSLVFTKNNVVIKWLIAYSVILICAGKLWFFTYNDYFSLVGLPLIYYGYIFFALNIVAAVVSHEAERIERWLGEKRSFILMPVLICVPLFIMGSWVALPFASLVIFQNFFRGYHDPFLSHFYHRHLDSTRRATLYSVRSAAISLAEVIGLFAFGLLLKTATLSNSLIILSLLVALPIAWLLIVFNRVFES